MFWTFLLAHLFADYPLQTKGLVEAKQYLPGLTLHVSLHLLTLTVLTFAVYAQVWPAALGITLAHITIDAGKNYVGHRRPDWFIGPYVVDQLLHIFTLLLAALWVQMGSGLPIWQVASPWIAYAIGVVLVTVFWFITESILVYRNEQLGALVARSRWLRMAVRLALYLLVVTAVPQTIFLAIAVLVVTVYKYRRMGYPPVWLIIDPLIALFCALLTWAILAI